MNIVDLLSHMYRGREMPDRSCMHPGITKSCTGLMTLSSGAEAVGIIYEQQEESNRSLKPTVQHRTHAKLTDSQSEHAVP